MSGEARIISVRQHPDTTPEQARKTRADAWRFILDCHAKKAAGTSGGEVDPEGIRDDRAAEKYT